MTYTALKPVAPIPFYRLLLCSIGVLWLSSGTLNAQIDNTQTLYSRFGVGELNGFSSSQTQALGGASAGLLTVNYLNFSNPAAWSDQVYTRFVAGFEYTGLRTQDAGDNQGRLNNGSLNAIQLGVPLIQRRLGMAFSLQPYSQVGYRTERTGTLPSENGEPGSDYVIHYDGDGGLYQVTAGAGYRLSRYVAAGASANFLFGIIDYRRRTLMSQSTQFVGETSAVTSTRMSGFTGTLGLMFVLPNVNDIGGRLTAGASLTLPAPLSAKRVYRIEQGLLTDTLGTTQSGDVTLPLATRFGVAFRPTPKWLLLAEGRYESWSSFESDFSIGGFDPNGATALRDRWRAGGGVEYLPAGNAFNPNFFGRLTYRLGAYADQAYYNPSTEYNIITYAVTGGLSLPSLFPGTYVDLNTELGTRGTTQFGLVRDVFFRFSATINFGERWFVKRRFR